MHELRRLIGSLDAVAVFETAGRLLSFTAAARELGLTQPAVSYAIQGLERQLGAPLFRRGRRRVDLTEVGQRFLTDVTLGLSVIRRSAEDISAFASDSHVTLAASTAFASFWMMPRLQRFRDELPGIDLRIQTSDRDLDIRAEGIALAVRGGRPEAWPGFAGGETRRGGDRRRRRRLLRAGARATGKRRRPAGASLHPSRGAASRGRDLGRLAGEQRPRARPRGSSSTITRL